MAEKTPTWSLDEQESGRKPVSSRPGLWRRRFIACGISSGISLLAAIAFLQYRAWTTIYIRSPDRESGIELLYDPLLGWRNVPHLKSTTYGKQLTINLRGLRDREHPLQKPSGVSRILVLGDSFAWGWGVADDEVFPEVLEVQLANVHPPWEVINSGVSGWATDQEYLFLTNEGFDYSPDLVVLAVFTGNDPFDKVRSMPYKRAKPVFLNTDLELANVPVPKPSSRKPEIWTQADKIDLTVAIITEIGAACAKRNCRFVVMKFGSYIDPADARFRSVDTRMAAAFATHAEIHYLDLDEQFAEQSLSFEELCGGNNRSHWNAEGHRQAARLLQRFLDDKGLLETQQAN